VNTRYPTTPTVEPFMVESRVPVAESRLTTHVFVPFLTALITMALITGCVMLWAWRPVAGIIGAVGLLAYAWRVLKADGGLTRLETITGLELDGKPGLGRPDHNVTLLNMRDYQPPTPTVSDITDGGTPTKHALESFVMSCYVMGKTSERAHGIRPWQRARYKDFRDSLLRLGLAEWQDAGNHNAGWRLVVAQDVALRTIAERVV
jgi:hypothetical protein